MDSLFIFYQLTDAAPTFQDRRIEVREGLFLVSSCGSLMDETGGNMSIIAPLTQSKIRQNHVKIEILYFGRLAAFHPLKSFKSNIYMYTRKHLSNFRMKAGCNCFC